MSEKSSFHLQGERKLKGAVKHGGADSGEFVGHESNPRVAEAMAYAAKPLIERALEDARARPNNLMIFKISDGTKGLSDAPGTVSESGYKRSYGDMTQSVNRGYEQANTVQERYYENIKNAEDALSQAEDALSKARENI